MQRPFYDSTFLKYLNYGALGSAVGHELSVNRYTYIHIAPKPALLSY
jgi:hypothetical protein